MWIERDFNLNSVQEKSLPIKVLTGPRQVGKTSLLQRLEGYELVYFDDAAVRIRAEENPRFFLDQLSQRLILDEASLAPALFPELKRRVDAMRTRGEGSIDVWITGSNQTLVQQRVRESLAGRASYFGLNTLSIHELGKLWNMPDMIMKGGWPELYASPQLDVIRYLNDLISTFIEKDIVNAAGIERHAAFIKTLNLMAGRVGQLFNASDIAASVGVDSTTIQSWLAILEANGVVRCLTPYHSNLNKRLTKSPKYYFEDVAMATRLQGWISHVPFITSPQFGSAFENLVLNEISRFFTNKGVEPILNFVRSKEKVEVDFIVDLGNRRFLAIEAKLTPETFTEKQIQLLDSLELDIVERWIVSGTPAPNYAHARVVPIDKLWGELSRI